MTGGGTGGHIYPLLAVAIELQFLSVEEGIDLKLKYLGSYGSYKELLSLNNIKVQKIVSSKLRRYFSISNFWDFFKFSYGVLQALWKIYWFMPDVLFSKGGPGALPVVLAAKFYRIPIIIHESDVVPGMTNIVSARFADIITVAFSGAAKYLGPASMPVGNPVRRYILPHGEDEDNKTAKKLLEFDSDKFLIFVVGGSQGSTRINDFIIENLGDLLQSSQILHQTGRNNYEQVVGQVAFEVEKMPEAIKKNYKAVDYFENGLGDAMLAADLIVARAGAGSIFEIAAFGKPSILIPLPESAGDHQRYNAYEYASTGASVVIEEENLLPHLFMAQLQKLLEHPEELQRMGEAAKRFYKKDSALTLARLILDFNK